MVTSLGREHPKVLDHGFVLPHPVYDGPSIGPTRSDGLDSPPHLVHFYEDEADFVRAAVRFIGTGLARGEAAVVIASKRHQQAVEQSLHDGGMDLTDARKKGLYTPVDAAKALSQFMVEGSPDGTRFADAVGALAVAPDADGRCRRRRVFSEMMALLWAEGQEEAAIRVEELWKDIRRTFEVSLLCAYPMAAFRGKRRDDRLLRVCAEHSHVFPTNCHAVLANAERLEEELTRFGGGIEDWPDANGFLAALEHKLRNSLGAVRTAIATASLDRTRGDRALEIARRQADRLGQLISEFTEAHRFVAIRRTRIPGSNDQPGEASESVTPGPAVSGANEDRPGGPVPNAHSGPVSVLVVEDDTDAAESLTMLLEVLGHRVRVVHDGDAGLAVAGAMVPDVMLIDIQLPGMDGYEVARRVRRDPALANVVLAALTGYGGEEHRLMAVAAGFDCHVTKPFEVDALQALVVGLEKWRSNRSAALQ